jgi:hypothetical protein
LDHNEIGHILIENLNQPSNSDVDRISQLISVFDEHEEQKFSHVE